MAATLTPPQPTAPETVNFRHSSDEQRRFIISDTLINIAYSGRGEGKTTGGLFAVLYHAHQMPRNLWPMRWALVRDTRRNIGITTARSILDWFPKPYSHWRGKPDEPESITLLVGHEPCVVFDCFGVNTPEDLSRFQSYEASGGIWIEEPAPAATNSETLSTGISETVLAVAITSVRGAPRPRIQVTLNPPPADHWTAQLWHMEGYDEAGDLELEMPEEQRDARNTMRSWSRVVRIPPGANVAIDDSTSRSYAPGYRERNRVALLATGRTDLIARLVEGRVGYAKIGAPVTPDFQGSIHLNPQMHVIPGRPFFLGWDFGLYHAVIVAQISPTGQLHIHYAVALPNSGTQQIIDKRLRPWLSLYPEVRQYIHIGGHEAFERDQSNSESSSFKTMIKSLGGRYISGPVAWNARSEACHDALTKYIGHFPWIQINTKDAAPLVRCLDGGWHYPTDVSGRPMRELPEKRGASAHLGDAFAHLVWGLNRKPGKSGNPFGNKEKRGPKPTAVSAYRSRTGV